VYTVLSGVIEDGKVNLNDKVIVNAAVALGFLSAYSSDPQQMKDLFYAFDGHNDYRVSLGIKLGILMNGSDKIPELAKLQQDVASYISQVLKTESGIIEIDGKDLKEGRPDEEIFRFDGALDTLGHIMNVYLRRFYKSDSAMSKLLFKAVTDAGLLQALKEEEDFSAMTEVYRQVPAFISALPVPSTTSKQKLSEEQAEVMRASFTFIHKYYLDFDSKKDAAPALLNLLGLTYNNCLDLSVSTGAGEITPLSSSYVRDTVCEVPALQGVIPADMKMVCNDIIFDK